MKFLQVNLKKSKYIIKNIALNKKLPAEKDYFLGEYYKTKFIIEKNKKRNKNILKSLSDI